MAFTPKQTRAEYQREWRKNNLERERGYKFKHRYGISLDEYQQLLETQNHKCAACKNPDTSVTHMGQTKPLSVDHDHVTGKVRGLLCHKCNIALGLLNDDKERIMALANYIKGNR